MQDPASLPPGDGEGGNQPASPQGNRAGGPPASPPGDGADGPPASPPGDGAEDEIAAAAAALPPPPSHDDAKLFIGMSGWAAGDAELQSLCEEFGQVEECYVMKMKGGRNKNCAFCKYVNKNDGNKAIAALNMRRTMPGAKGPLVVKWADQKPPEQQAAPVPLADTEHRVFIGLSSYNVTNEQVMELVQKFGDVEEAYVMKAKGGANKACAMVKFKTKEAGQAAINELHEQHTFEGAEKPIIVKWAEAPKPQQLPVSEHSLPQLAGSRL